MITDLLTLAAQDNVSVQAIRPFIKFHTQDESTCEVVVDFQDNLTHRHFSIPSTPHATVERCLEEVKQRYTTHNYSDQVRQARLKMLDTLTYWYEANEPPLLKLVESILEDN